MSNQLIWLMFYHINMNSKIKMIIFGWLKAVCPNFQLKIWKEKTSPTKVPKHKNPYWQSCLPHLNVGRRLRGHGIGPTVSRPFRVRPQGAALGGGLLYGHNSWFFVAATSTRFSRIRSGLADIPANYATTNYIFCNKIRIQIQLASVADPN